MTFTLVSYKAVTLIVQVLPLVLMCAAGTAYAAPGTFEGQNDIGRITRPGSVHHDPTRDTYRITGSGENMWGNEDAFFYLWRRVQGDLALTTTIAWEGKGKQAHRKAGWMIRSGLDKDAPYIDAVIHGDGLISMQYRRTKGAATTEVQSPVKAPATLLLERDGDQVTLSITGGDGQIHPVGTVTLELRGELYAGLAVCSHDSTTSETAVFSNTVFKQKDRVPEDQRLLESTLEIMDIRSGVRSIVRRATEHFEAPNWSRDGKTLIYNKDGKLNALPAGGGTPIVINTGFADRCNNDHGLSPDGKELAISHHGKDGKSMIYIIPRQGGEPRQITPLGPSYWHGWSPDGKTLAYCAERNGEFDVYTIPVSGGQEQRLTTTPGLDDGPDYSPDGAYIYFNSVRTGQMKIWRMNADGSGQTQVTPDDTYGDWFAHPSPDGKLIVFVSYDKSVEGHPANKDVVLRIMPTAGGEPKILANLFGGQGTMNVPSWSPDGTMIAFVSYRLLAP
jgi:Tol biopolymer transport system component